MNQVDGNHEKLKQEISFLRQRCDLLEDRLSEAQSALEAIRSGEVDAVVVYTDEGEKIFTIQGADSAYRTLVESINEGAATLIEDGTILYCNACFADLLKYPLEQIIGSSVYQYIAPEFQPMFHALLLQGLKGRGRNEVALLRKDGRPVVVMASLNPFSAEGNSGVCLVASDLTERKRVEELTRQEALQADTFSEISRQLVEVGLDHKAIMGIVAHSAVQLTGDACLIHLLSPDRQAFELAAHSLPEEMEEDFNAISFQQVPFLVDQGILGTVLLTGKAIIYPSDGLDSATPEMEAEIQLLKKHLKGSDFLVLPVHTFEDIIGTLMLVRQRPEQAYTLEDQRLAQRVADQMALAFVNAQLYNDLQIALRKEQEMRAQLIQAEKLAALSRMMGSMVHEINNPMQAIKNWIYLARSATPEGTPLAEYMNMLSVETERISKLVSNMRVFYHPPKSDPMHTLDLQKNLAEIHQLLDYQLVQHNIGWIQASSKEPLWIQGISDQIKQVFLNIFLNAIEAMQPNGGTITVRCQLDHANQEVSVSVNNTGPWIKPEILPHLFEPFFTTKANGTGLGLAICYEIIQRHAGRIEVASAPQEGVTFTIRLPYHLAESETA